MTRAVTIAGVPTAMLHLVAAALILSGLDKLRSPEPATTAWRSAQVPGARLGKKAPGLLLGLIEVAVGATAIVTGARGVAVAVGVLYLAFAWFVRRLSKRDSSAGCGCFGASNAPPGPGHLVLDLSAAAAAFVAAVTGALPAAEMIGDGVSVAVPYIALLVIGAAVMLLGPALSADIRVLRSGERTRAFAIDT